MKKVLIFGANGFVGNYLCKELINNNYTAYGVDVNSSNMNEGFKDIFNIDILDEKQVYKIIKQISPDYIVNLAAISSVKKSWDKPQLTFDINVKGTINILEAVKILNLDTKMLFVGSSEEYGDIDYSKSISEKNELKPVNPYAISKVTQEMITLLYRKNYGLNIVLVRAFNHIGVGQNKGFVVPDFASQIAEIEKNNRKAIIKVGNLSAERDFSDVRDVVRAYRILLEKGQSGEIYNVGSGKTVSIEKILDYLIKKCKIPVEVKVDESKFRKVETPKIQSDCTKINSLGWQAEIDIKQSLKEILDYWRNISS